MIYNNDGNAAALYAHEHLFGAEAPHRSSVAAIVGTGLGGGVVDRGQIVRGASGMAGEFGHVHIPMDGLLEPDQPVPRCNCGLAGDLESVASLSGIERNLLPYWLGRYPGPSARRDRGHARRARRRGPSADTASQGDELAMQIFTQQAAAIGRMFTIASNYTDPDAYFVGGGVVESAAHFRDWFLDAVRDASLLRDEQRAARPFRRRCRPRHGRSPRFGARRSTGDSPRTRSGDLIRSPDRRSGRIVHTFARTSHVDVGRERRLAWLHRSCCWMPRGGSIG